MECRKLSPRGAKVPGCNISEKKNTLLMTKYSISFTYIYHFVTLYSTFLKFSTIFQLSMLHILSFRINIILKNLVLLTKY